MAESIEKVKGFITNPDRRFQQLARLGFYKNMPDAEYLKKMFKIKMGYDLDLENPKTFNEKINWLKIYDRNPEYTTMVDKYEAKKWVADRIGEEYIIPTLGVWDHYDDINFDSLPDRFVLKCTHDSGGLVIVKDKAAMDKKAAKKKLEKCLKRNYFWVGREWPYKNVKPRIIAEKYIGSPDAKHGLHDYKIFVFDGVAKAFYITSDRGSKSGTCIDVYDIACNKLPFKWGYQKSDYSFIKPDKFEDIIKFAERLGEGIPHIRVDFYNINGTILFGEMTFYTWSGFVPFEPKEYDRIFGEWLTLPAR